MDKRKLSIVFAGLLGICIFSFSFYYCWNKLKGLESDAGKQQVKAVKGRESQDSLSVQSRVYDIVLKDTKIVFKTKYGKCGTVVVNKEQQPEELIGKTREELDEMYSSKGYKVSSITASEAVLLRELDRYEPDKYVLGIKNGYIAIFKTDKEGNMFIQDENRDITDIKANKLKEEDIKLLTKGDTYFQYSTREEAQAILEDYE